MKANINFLELQLSSYIDKYRPLRNYTHRSDRQIRQKNEIER